MPLHLTVDDIHADGYEVVSSSSTIDKDNINYLVNTTSAAVTLTVDSSLTHFIVYDSHANFAANNCTVDFGGGTSRTMSLDGEFMLFYKDGSTWRLMSLGVASVGAV